MSLLKILYIFTIFLSLYCSVGYIKDFSSRVFSDYISVGGLLSVVVITVMLFLISIVPLVNLLLIGRAYLIDKTVVYKDSYLDKVLSYKLWSR